MSVQKVTSHRKTADLSDWGILLPHAHSAGWTWAWESSYLTHLLPTHGQLYLPSVPILSPPRVAILRVGAQQCGLQSQTKVKSAGGGEGTPHGLAVRGGALRWQPTSQSQSRDPDSSHQDWVPDGAMIPTEQYVPVSPSRRTPKETNPTHRSPYHKQLSPGRPSLRVGWPDSHPRVPSISLIWLSLMSSTTRSMLELRGML